MLLHQLLLHKRLERRVLLGPPPLSHSRKRPHQLRMLLVSAAQQRLQLPSPDTRITGNLFEAAAAASRAPASGAAASGAAGAGAGARTGGSSEMAAIAAQPIFGQLRQLVQQNPALLQPFLQQLGASNPELLSVRRAREAVALVTLT